MDRKAMIFSVPELLAILDAVIEEKHRLIDFDRGHVIPTGRQQHIDLLELVKEKIDSKLEH